MLIRNAREAIPQGVTVGATVAAVLLVMQAGVAVAQSDEQDLAKKLTNPVAALISVPFQANYDENYGPDEEGSKFFVNVQPVIPFALSDDWNLISRTILPIVDQDDVVPSSSASGIGDVLQSLFFSPAAPTAGGVIWGVGPALLLPTGSDSELSARKWALGPTAVALRQHGSWTYGVLANHLWSVAGDDDRADVSSTFIQPFVAHTTPNAWTYTLNSEATYDWNAEEWSIPINAMVTKLTKFGQQPVSIGGGVRYWADSPDNGPQDWGFRFVVTFLFPK